MSYVVDFLRFVGSAWALIGFAVLAAAAFLPAITSPRRARR